MTSETTTTPASETTTEPERATGGILAGLEQLSLGYWLVIFDIDGTLVETASGDTFRQYPEDWKFIGAHDDDPLGTRVRRLQALRRRALPAEVMRVRYSLASNQGGCAVYPHRLPEKRMAAEIHKVAEAIGASSAFYSAHHPRDTDTQVVLWRKPGPGMLDTSMSLAQVPASRALMVGDRLEDLHAARRANGGRGIDFCWAWHFFGEPIPASVPKLIVDHVTPGIVRAGEEIPS